MPKRCPSLIVVALLLTCCMSWASFHVLDESGEKLSAQQLRVGVNQTGKDMWATEARDVATDKDGKCLLEVDDPVPGYLTLMATIASPDPAIEVVPAVVMRRVDPKAEED